MHAVSSSCSRCAALVPLASAPEPAPLDARGADVMVTSSSVELTPHGPVAYSVITAPAPAGLTTIGPVLGAGTVTGPRQTMTQLEERVGAT